MPKSRAPKKNPGGGDFQSPQNLEPTNVLATGKKLSLREFTLLVSGDPASLDDLYNLNLGSLKIVGTFWISQSQGDCCSCVRSIQSRVRFPEKLVSHVAIDARVSVEIQIRFGGVTNSPTHPFSRIAKVDVVVV